MASFVIQPVATGQIETTPIFSEDPDVSKRFRHVLVKQGFSGYVLATGRAFIPAQSGIVSLKNFTAYAFSVEMSGIDSPVSDILARTEERYTHRPRVQTDKG